jgi:predicted acyltransferase
LCVGGYSAAAFAVFYWLADVKGWRKWTFFFVVIGVNSITIYLLQRFVDFMGVVKFFLGGVASRLPPAGASLLLACGYLALSWLLLLFLYRKKVFLKV